MQLAQRMHGRLRGLERAHGVYVVQDTNKVKKTGSARTVAESVTDILWKKHLDGIQGIGIVPIDDDALCRWGAIDIDVYKGLDYGEFEQRVADNGFPLVLCKSKSGGVHAFLFMQEPTLASTVQRTLIGWAARLGFPKAEVFPKQTQLADTTDFGSWLNMPYFGGDNSDRHCFRGGRRLTVEEFLVWASERAQTSEGLTTPPAGSDDDLLQGCPPCIAAMAVQRLGADSGRNDWLLDYLTYARMRWGDDFESKVRAFNKRFFANPLDEREVVGTILRSSKRKVYKYRCSRGPMKALCNQTLCSQMEFGKKETKREPGVVIRNLRRAGDSWYVSVDGAELSLPDTLSLMEQRRFRRLCLEQLYKLPNQVKEETWNDIIRELLVDVQHIAVPDEMTDDGSLWAEIRVFLLTHLKVLKSPLGDPALAAMQHQSLVMADEQFYYFVIEGLTEHLLYNSRGARKDRAELWRILKEHGATLKKWQFRSGDHITLYLVPRDQCRQYEQSFKGELHGEEM